MIRQSQILLDKNRTFIHCREWLCELLTEIIEISIFIESIMQIMDQMQNRKSWASGMKEIDSLMLDMPDFIREKKFKDFFKLNVGRLHRYGKKAYNVVYTDLDNMLKELDEAEALFSTEAMEECGETDVELFTEMD